MDEQIQELRRFRFGIAHSFCDNSVKTSKYTLLNFIPKNVTEQFRRTANFYFLLIGLMMVLGTWTELFDSVLTPWSTLCTLMVVMTVSMFFAARDDISRHRSDRKQDSRKCFKVVGQHSSEEVELKNIKVGDVITLKNNESVPADCILLATSEEGNCHIETSNLDGETNLKTRQVPKKIPMGPGKINPSDLLNLEIECDLPNEAIYSFNGSLKFANDEKTVVGVGCDGLLLRGCTVRNCEWAQGIVVYTGEDTKLAMNARRTPHKMSRVETTVNTSIWLIFFAMGSLCLATDLLYLAWKEDNGNPWYLGDEEDYILPEWMGKFFSFAILYNNFVPISLYVTLEMVNLCQAKLVDKDEQIYDEESDTPAKCRSANLMQEIGQVQYIFSDKTGTLTANEMRFSRCCVAGCVFGAADDSSKKREDETRSSVTNVTNKSTEAKSLAPFDYMKLRRALESNGEIRDFAEQFVLCMVLCHTVMIDRSGGHKATPHPDDDSTPLEYQAESPDELALVEAARSLGYELRDRTAEDITIKCQGKMRKWKILAVNAFTSARARMSVMTENEMGQIEVWVKGSDSAMIAVAHEYLALSNFEEMSNGSQDAQSTVSDVSPEEKMESRLSQFSRLGLRTLIVGKRLMRRKSAMEWLPKYEAASQSVHNRSKSLNEVAVMLEKKVSVIGVTAVEDRLQDEVPETIEKLGKAGIKLWVLTGDKVETAVSIARSCNLILPTTNVLRVVGNKKDSVKAELVAAADALVNLKPVADNGILELHKQACSEYMSTIEEEDETRVMPLKTSPSMPSIVSAVNHGDEIDDNASGVSGVSSVTSPPTNTPGEDGSTESNDPNEKKPPSICDVKGMCANCLDTSAGAVDYTLVVSGMALLIIFRDRALQDILLNVGKVCRSVVACRVAPKQKAAVVKLIKDHAEPSPVCLSIGDGANDCSMLLEAHVGVGISGKEGKQAVNSSDFAIAQFKFLAPLLLVHGRWNYRRNAKVIIYSFYKNILLTLTLFGFATLSGFSGTAYFDDWVYSLFNFYAGASILLLGIFDKDISREMALRFPALYLSGRRNIHLNRTKMFQSVLLAIAHASIIWWWVGDDRAVGSDVPVVGHAAFTMMLFIVHYKVFMYTKTWNWMSCLVWLLSPIAYFATIIPYSMLCTLTPQYCYVPIYTFFAPQFWLFVFGVPVAAMVFDYSVSFARKMYWPSPIDIGREIEHFGLPINAKFRVHTSDEIMDFLSRRMRGLVSQANHTSMVRLAGKLPRFAGQQLLSALKKPHSVVKKIVKIAKTPRKRTNSLASGTSSHSAISSLSRSRSQTTSSSVSSDLPPVASRDGVPLVIEEADTETPELIHIITPGSSNNSDHSQNSSNSNSN
eukprot:TRINITY_DN2602_c0_g2_i3.p1 TRINITY_DN2602_c0_g2~~TRINITY_DN2602_c0_g2_i3.p1  ORF type:complete len:1362 (-),score=419.44 TRINITY_DN2602_c0_g2_i3:1230-5315(-)